MKPNRRKLRFQVVAGRGRSQRPSSPSVTQRGTFHHPPPRPMLVSLPSPEEFYRRFLEDLHVYPNGWASARCPFHPDRHPSFSVNLKTGHYRCRAPHCAETGRDIVSFVSAYLGLSRDEAIRYLSERRWR